MATAVPICQGRLDDLPPEEEEKDLDAVNVLGRKWFDDCNNRPDDMAEDRMALAAIGVMMKKL